MTELHSKLIRKTAATVQYKPLGYDEDEGQITIMTAELAPDDQQEAA